MSPVARLTQVVVEQRASDLLDALIGDERAARFETMAQTTRELLGGRAVLNVSSTAKGGGVAELLQTLLAYARGVGVDARWFVIDGDPAFFEVTNRVHNHLYGSPGDGGPLGASERRRYERTLRANADELAGIVRPGDVVLLHDPQTAALAETVRRAGGVVVWRSHVGIDIPNAHVDEAWAFLRPYVEGADAFVFSRRAFAPAWIDHRRLHVIAPSIDPFSAKNYEMAPGEAVRMLRYVGLLAGADHPMPAPFVRRDGSPGRIDRHADILQTGPPPPSDRPLVVQACRWDRLKDMPGVMAGFAEVVAQSSDAHLVLAGPSVTGVADDPESRARSRGVHRRLARPAHAQRARVHLACTPMRDPDEDRGDRERAATPCVGGDAEEPGRRLRAHGRRVDVEAATHRGQRARRHRRPDRRRRARPPTGRSQRPRRLRQGGAAPAGGPRAGGAARGQCTAAGLPGVPAGPASRAVGHADRQHALKR